MIHSYFIFYFFIHYFFYIGSSVNFYRRFSDHLKLSKKENTKCHDGTAKVDINDYNYYHNSFIYKFIHKITGELLYIGSTNQDITCRINKHKSLIININNGKKNRNGEIKNKVSDKEKIMYKKIKNEIGMDHKILYIDFLFHVIHIHLHI